MFKDGESSSPKLPVIYEHIVLRGEGEKKTSSETSAPLSFISKGYQEGSKGGQQVIWDGRITCLETDNSQINW